MEAYQKKVELLQQESQVDFDVGLSPAEVKRRHEEFGLNRFEEERKSSFVKKFLHSLGDFTTIILLVAAGISFYTAIATDHGDYFEGILIIAIVLINSLLAIIQEGNAEKSLQALQQMNKQRAVVKRAGQVVEIDAEEVVPGDILVLETGMSVVADGRLIQNSQLRVDEASLTGESEAIEKTVDFVGEADTPLGDRRNMVYKGTTILNGRGQVFVTATGMATEMGKIAELLNRETNDKTPLQKRLNQLGKRISLIALAAAGLVFFIGQLQGEPLLEMFMTAVSLAVAAVPETLTVIVTLTLAYGVQQMAKKHAIIRQLPAVETLGTANVICSDKTGTLTQNKMRVRQVWRQGDEVTDIENLMTDEAMEVLQFAALNTDVIVTYENDEVIVKGNPTEAAIVRAIEENYHTKAELEEKYPRVGEIPFDSDRKMMTTVHKMGKRYLSITKGAFDILLPKFKYGNVEQAAVVNDRFGKRALRVIAVGYAKTTRDSAGSLRKRSSFIGLNRHD
ncbi:magnesium-transporting ATPase (P-type) [Enterococcus sp. PF1-24]|nr:magnesium-transporting ATPase (P-type) [Enterococcus sp. PFB1-1]MDH6400538.1 magnesium-transporting ATPase (P-type) [Enterococcus sp. PF1-24]